MEDTYLLNHDCMIECARIMTDRIILFRLSCCMKINRHAFTSSAIFIPNDKYQANDVKKFTHVHVLNLTKTNKFIRLDYFKDLENLTVSKWNTRFCMYDPLKLTYLDNLVDKNDREGYVTNLKTYNNLIYLNHPFIQEIKTLTNLRSLVCIFRDKIEDILNLNLLSNLTKLCLKLHTLQDTCIQDITISKCSKLIELRAQGINFSKKKIHGDLLKCLDLNNSKNLHFESLKNIQVICFQSIDNIRILNEDNSYHSLTGLKINMKDRILMNFSRMVNLKYLDMSNYQQSPKVNLSFLISLEKLYFLHNTRNNINIVNLINLSSLYFINHGDNNMHDYKIELPRNIQKMFFQDYSRKDLTCLDTWTHNILIQTNSMQHLTSLSVQYVLFDEHKLNLIRTTRLNKLNLRKCRIGHFNNFINLKHLILDEMDMNNVNTRYLSTLKKLTMKNCEHVAKNKLTEFRDLDNLRLIDKEWKIKIGCMSKLTSLSLAIELSNLDIELEKIYKLKSLTVDNINLFLKLCLNRFPISLKDIYIKMNKSESGHAYKLHMDDIKLHFVE